MYIRSSYIPPNWDDMRCIADITELYAIALRGDDMTKFDQKTFSTPELLRCFADILDDLKQRDVVRTRNNLVADYTEWLVAQKLGLSLERNSKSGYDGTNTSGERFQIKSRRRSL